MANLNRRPLIAFDGNSWFVRSIAISEHDLDTDEMVYRCDMPIGGPYNTLREATNAAYRWLKGE